MTDYTSDQDDKKKKKPGEPEVIDASASQLIWEEKQPEVQTVDAGKSKLIYTQRSPQQRRQRQKQPAPTYYDPEADVQKYNQDDLQADSAEANAIEDRLRKYGLPDYKLDRIKQIKRRTWNDAKNTEYFRTLQTENRKEWQRAAQIERDMAGVGVSHEDNAWLEQFKTGKAKIQQEPGYLGVRKVEDLTAEEKKAYDISGVITEGYQAQPKSWLGDDQTGTSRLSRYALPPNEAEIDETGKITRFNTNVWVNLSKRSGLTGQEYRNSVSRAAVEAATQDEEVREAVQKWREATLGDQIFIGFDGEVPLENVEHTKEIGNVVEQNGELWGLYQDRNANIRKAVKVATMLKTLSGKVSADDMVDGWGKYQDAVARYKKESGWDDILSEREAQLAGKERTWGSTLFDWAARVWGLTEESDRFYTGGEGGSLSSEIATAYGYKKDLTGNLYKENSDGSREYPDQKALKTLKELVALEEHQLGTKFNMMADRLQREKGGSSLFSYLKAAARHNPSLLIAGALGTDVDQIMSDESLAPYKFSDQFVFEQVGAAGTVIGASALNPALGIVTLGYMADQQTDDLPESLKTANLGILMGTLGASKFFGSSMGGWLSQRATTGVASKVFTPLTATKIGNTAPAVGMGVTNVAGSLAVNATNLEMYRTPDGGIRWGELMVNSMFDPIQLMGADVPSALKAFKVGEIQAYGFFARNNTTGEFGMWYRDSKTGLANLVSMTEDQFNAYVAKTGKPVAVQNYNAEGFELLKKANPTFRQAYNKFMWGDIPPPTEALSKLASGKRVLVDGKELKAYTIGETVSRPLEDTENRAYLLLRLLGEDQSPGLKKQDVVGDASALASIDQMHRDGLIEYKDGNIGLTQKGKILHSRLGASAEGFETLLKDVRTEFGSAKNAELPEQIKANPYYREEKVETRISPEELMTMGVKQREALAFEVARGDLEFDPVSNVISNTEFVKTADGKAYGLGKNSRDSKLFSLGKAIQDGNTDTIDVLTQKLGEDGTPVNKIHAEATAKYNEVVEKGAAPKVEVVKPSTKKPSMYAGKGLSDYEFSPLKENDLLPKDSSITVQDVSSGRIITWHRQKNGRYKHAMSVKTHGRIEADIREGTYLYGRLPVKESKSSLKSEPDFILQTEKIHEANEKAFTTGGKIKITANTEIDLGKWAEGDKLVVSGDDPNQFFVNESLMQKINTFDSGKPLNADGLANTAGYLKRVLASDSKSTEEFRQLTGALTAIPDTDGVHIQVIDPDRMSYSDTHAVLRHEYTHKKLIDASGSLKILPDKVLAGVFNSPESKRFLSGVGKSLYDDFKGDLDKVSQEVMAMATDKESLYKLGVDIDNKQSLDDFVDVYYGLVKALSNEYGDDRISKIIKYGDTEILKEYERQNQQSATSRRREVPSGERETGIQRASEDSLKSMAGSGEHRVQIRRFTPTGNPTDLSGIRGKEHRLRVADNALPTWNFYVSRPDGSFVVEREFENTKLLSFTTENTFNLLDMAFDRDAMQRYMDVRFPEFQRWAEEQGYDGVYNSSPDQPDSVRYRVQLFQNEKNRAKLLADSLPSKRELAEKIGKDLAPQQKDYLGSLHPEDQVTAAKLLSGTPKDKEIGTDLLNKTAVGIFFAKQKELVKKGFTLDQAEGLAREYARNYPANGTLYSKRRITADTRAVIALVRETMYKGDLVEINTKETVQNAFDAVRAAMEKGLIANAKIDVAVDRTNRTLTITDNGVGMDRDIITNAFTTLGVSSKEGESNSGGFGMAKATFLIGNEHIDVTTIRNGEKHIFRVSEENIDKDIDIVTKPTKEPSGTVIKMQIPEKVSNMSGQERNVWLPLDKEGFLFSRVPLLGDVELTFTDNTYGKKTEVIPVGKNTDLSDKTKLNVSFDWGAAEIYVDNSPAAGMPTHSIMSSGIWQFNHRFEIRPYERFPHNLMVNIKPTVSPKDATYPFNLQREGFKHTVEDDINALSEYIAGVGRNYEAEKTQEQFRDMKQLPRVEVSGRPLSRDVVEAISKQLVSRSTLRPPIQFEDVSVKTGVVFNKRGETISSKKLDKSFKAEEGLKSALDYMLESDLDPNKPVFHNNTNIDWLGEFPSAAEFFAELGSVVTDFRDLAKDVTSDWHEYELLRDPNTKFFAGLSVDKTYYGVNIPIPYKGMFLNPFGVRRSVSSVAGVAGQMFTTLSHEIAHVPQKGHDESFVSAMADVFAGMVDKGYEAQIRAKLETVLVKYEDLYNSMRKRYDDYTTKNVKKSLEGIRSKSDELLKGYEGFRDGGFKPVRGTGSPEGVQELSFRNIRDQDVAGEGQRQGGYGSSLASLRGFYSPLERAVLSPKVPKKAKGKNYLSIIRAAFGVKQDELNWSGIEVFLQDNAENSLTREDVLNFARHHEVVVKDLVYGGKPYDDYLEATASGDKSMTDMQSEMLAAGSAGQSQWSGYTMSGERFDDVEIVLKVPVLRRGETKGIGDIPPLPDGWHIKLDTESRYVDGKPKYVAVDWNGNNRFASPTEEMVISKLKEYLDDSLNKWYSSPHWEDISNTILHVRGNGRIDTEGVTGFLLEEAQSDLHQEGREHGYITAHELRVREASTAEDLEKLGYTVRYEDGFSVIEKDGKTLLRTTQKTLLGEDVANREFGDIGDLEEGYPTGTGRIPEAPFADTWLELGFKTALRYAVENGYKRFYWTTGKQQIDRYESALRQNVDKIEYSVANPELSEKRKAEGKVLHKNLEEAESKANELYRQIRKKLFPDSRGDSGVDFEALNLYLRRDHEYKLARSNFEAAKQAVQDFVKGHIPDNFVKISTYKDGMLKTSVNVLLEGSTVISQRNVSLDNLLGTKMAAEIREKGTGVFEGKDLSIGGAMHKLIYDEKLPNFVSKYVKKWGAKVGKAQLVTRPKTFSLELLINTTNAGNIAGHSGLGNYRVETRNGSLVRAFDTLTEAQQFVDETVAKPTKTEEFWSVDITKEMGESVLEGQSLFMKRDERSSRRGKLVRQQIDAERTQDLASVRQDRLIRERYLTPPAKATRKQLKPILETGTFSILASEDMDGLKADLDSMGYFYYPAKGVYMGYAPEDSLVVWYPDEYSSRVIQAIGNKHNQDSVLHGNNGEYRLEYHDGTTINSSSFREIGKKATFKGSAYRAESGLGLKGKSARDVIDFEADELGNADIREQALKAAEQLGIDLSKISSRDIVWVTNKKKSAEKYLSRDERGKLEGEVEKEDFGDTTPVILAKDGDDGFLIYKSTSTKDGTYITLPDGKLNFTIDFDFDAPKKPAEEGYSLANAQMTIDQRKLYRDKSILTLEDQRQIMSGEVVVEDGSGNVIDLKGVYDMSGKKVGQVDVDDTGREYIKFAAPQKGKKVYLIDGKGQTEKKVDTMALEKGEMPETFHVGTGKKDIFSAMGFVQEVFKLLHPDLEPLVKENTEEYRIKLSERLRSSIHNTLKQWALTEDSRYGRTWYQETEEFAKRVSRDVKDVSNDIVKLGLYLMTAATSPGMAVKTNARFAVNAMASLVRFYDTGKLEIPVFQYDNDGQLSVSETGSQKGFRYGTPVMKKLSLMAQGWIPATSAEGAEVIKMGQARAKTYSEITGEPPKPKEASFVKSPALEIMLEKYGAFQGLINFLLSPSVGAEPFKSMDMLGDKLGAFFVNLAGMTQVPTIDTWMNRYLLLHTGDALKVERNKNGRITKITDRSLVFNQADGDFYRGIVQKATEDWNNISDKKLTPADVQAILWTQTKSLFDSITTFAGENIDFGEAYRQIQEDGSQQTLFSGLKELPAAESNPKLVADVKEPASKIATLLAGETEQGARYYIENYPSLAMKRAEGQKAKMLKIMDFDEKLRSGNAEAWTDLALNFISNHVLSEGEAERIQHLSNAGDIEKLQKFVLGLSKQGVTELFVDFLRVNPLVGVKNLARNISANELHQTANELAKIPAFAINLGLVGLNDLYGGKNRGQDVSLPNLAANLHALWKTVTEGIPAAWNVMTKGVGESSFEHPSLFRDRTTGWLPLKPLELYTKYGFRLQEAVDRPFKVQAYHRSIDEITYRKAKELGVSFKEAQEYLTTGDHDQAWNTALYLTFQDQNKIADIYYKYRDKQNPLTRALMNFSVPYIKTPLNVVKVALDYSGLYPLIKGLNSKFGHTEWGEFHNTIKEILDTPEDREAISYGVGKGMVGWSLGYIGYKLGVAGLLTSFFDRDDQKEWEENTARGTSFGSLIANGRSYDISSLTPVSFYLLAGAAWANAEKEADQGSKKSVAENAITDILKNLALQVPLLSQGVKSWDDLQKKGNVDYSYWLGINRATPAISQEIAKTLDTKERVIESSTFGQKATDTLKSQIPVLRETLPVKYDMLGREIEAPVGLDPLKSKTVSTDPLIKELDKFDITLSSKYVDSAVERNIQKGEKGRYFEPHLKYVIESDAYKQSPDETKKEMLTDTIRYLSPEFKRDNLKPEEEKHNVSMILERESFRNKIKENPQQFSRDRTITDKKTLQNIVKLGVTNLTWNQILSDLGDDFDEFLDKQMRFNFNVDKDTSLTTARKEYQEFKSDPEGAIIKWYLSQQDYKIRSERLKQRREELANEGKSDDEIDKILASESAKRGWQNRKKKITKFEMKKDRFRENMIRLAPQSQNIEVRP